MKDGNVIFQYSFITGNGKKFCAKRKINLSQAIFHSQPNEFLFCAERNEAWLKDG